MRQRRRTKGDTIRRAGLLAVAGALAAGIAGVLGRRSSGGGGDGGARAGQGLAARFRRDKRPRYTCECGQAYRVTGVDRHRVYWPEGAERNAPVMGDTCVNCDRALPLGHDIAVTA